ncbi:AbrB/MazE/SpoVT family DNA-binding domain-containing protein [Mycolicibacter icosiumassiliensis]|nr:AbrB/MazE/SpoVT family DNA-binding domain-containing protein [Mycolicibacter icosiumassiliensis]
MDVSAKLTSKGQVTVPKAVRDALDLKEEITSSSVSKVTGQS